MVDCLNDYMDKVVELVDLRKNMPLNQIVYNGLRTSIIKGIIPVGERINEKKYSIELNVSRTPIREALYRIYDEGLIDYVPNSGFIVKKTTVADVEEIYKIRIALDTLASINAMNLMKAEDFKNMKELLELTEKLEEEGKTSEVIKKFSDFNEMIYTYCEMPRLKMIIHNLRDYLTRFRDISLLDENRRRKAFDEHKLIYYCLRDKDEVEITNLIKKHLDSSKKFVIEKVRQQDELDL